MSATAEEKTIRFKCACGQTMEAPAEMSGQMVECPDCQQPVQARDETEKKATRKIKVPSYAEQCQVGSVPLKEHESMRAGASTILMMMFILIVAGLLCGMGYLNADSDSKVLLLGITQLCGGLSVLFFLWYQLLSIRASLEEANYLKRRGP